MHRVLRTVAQIVLLCAVIAYAAAAATAGANAKMPVVVDGRVLFQVGDAGTYPAAERAAMINERLCAAAASTQPYRLSIDAREGMPTILLDDEHLLSVVDADVVPGMGAGAQAQLWVQAIDAALAQGRAERAPGALRRAGGRSLILVAAALLLHWLVRRLGRRLPQWLAGRRGSAVTMPPAWHTAFRLLLALVQIALWLVVTVVVVDAFPATRNARYTLAALLQESLAAPLFAMKDRSYSALDILWLVSLVAVWWIVVSVLTRLMASRVRRATGADRGVLEPIAVVVQYGLTFLGVVIILQSRGLDLSSLTIPASVLGVGIGFGLQNIANNFVSGLIISFERPIQLGDFVQVGERSGTVERIGARSTEIRTLDQVSIIVPNSRFLDTEVINWSHGDPLSRLHVPVGVAYGSDIQRVRAALLDAAKSHPEVVSDPRPEVRFDGFGDSALSFDLLVWTRDPRGQALLKSDLHYRIAANLARYGIEVPFPHRTLHIPASQVSEILTAWRRTNTTHDVELLDSHGVPATGAQDNHVASPHSSTAAAVEPAHLTALDIDTLVARMRALGGLDIRDRRHLLTVYPKCFVGSEAVEWMMRNAELTREEAVRIGKTLVDRGILHHVLDEHHFRDGDFFYRFQADEEETADDRG